MSSKPSLLALIAALILMTAPVHTGAQLTNQTDWPDNIVCNVSGWRDSDTDHYNSVIKHLDKLEGSATLGHQPGGGWCFLYSCEYNIGVYACNDNEPHDVQVPWSFMVEYAGHIRGTCTIQRKIDGKWKERILGQAFHPGGWNLIVGISTEKGC